MRQYPVVPRSAVLVGIDWIGKVLVSVLAVGTLAFLTAVLFFRDPNAWAIAERQQMDEIRGENRAFCEKFGLPLGTARHDECAAELMKIRDLHQKRLFQAELSIL